MNKYILTLLITLSITSQTFSFGVGNYIGNTYYYNDYSTGNSFTIQTIGNTNYLNGSDGSFATGQWIGNSYYVNNW